MIPDGERLVLANAVWNFCLQEQSLNRKSIGQITGHFGIVQGAFAELTDVPFTDINSYGQNRKMGVRRRSLHLDNGTVDGMQHGNVMDVIFMAF